MDDRKAARIATPLRRPPPVAPLQLSLRSFRRQFSHARRPRIDVGWASECGLDHGRNQDAVLAKQPFFAVADGVGGGSAGELASSQMLTYCSQIPLRGWMRADHLAVWLKQSDRVIQEALKALETAGPSATTFAGLWLQRNGHARMAHVGDARLMLIGRRGGHWFCEGVTVDQTYGNLGEVPPAGGSADDPARMVGVGAIGEPEIGSRQLDEGELVLLCTDGLHRFVSPERIAQVVHLSDAEDRSLTWCATQLVACAKRSGSRDDVSALLVRLNPRLNARRAVWRALAFAVVLAIAALSWQSTLGSSDAPAVADARPCTGACGG